MFWEKYVFIVCSKLWIDTGRKSQMLWNCPHLTNFSLSNLLWQFVHFQPCRCLAPNKISFFSYTQINRQLLVPHSDLSCLFWSPKTFSASSAVFQVIASYVQKHSAHAQHFLFNFESLITALLLQFIEPITFRRVEGEGYFNTATSYEPPQTRVV